MYGPGPGPDMQLASEVPCIKVSFTKTSGNDTEPFIPSQTKSNAAQAEGKGNRMLLTKQMQPGQTITHLMTFH